MIVVEKGEEPEGLKALREKALKEQLSPEDSYQLLQNPLKRDVIAHLKKDQGQLCVYCMGKIPREDLDPGIPGETIEHFIPLDPEDGRNVGQALDYQNLFAVCHGNTRVHRKGTPRKRSKNDLTCDKHRGNTEFKKIHPCRAETLQSITYTLDGKIKASDPSVEYDLVNTLNLNCATSPIVSERKSTLDALLEEMSVIEESKLYNYCKDRLEIFENEKNPKTPYVGVLIWYLQSMVNALEEKRTDF